MRKVNVYRQDGSLAHSVQLPEKVQRVPGSRFGVGESGLSYKGTGTKYSGHHDLEKKYSVLGRSDIPYMGYRVFNEKWKGKEGVFTERYQPQFKDYIGGCGPKEAKVLEHSILFPLSAVSVVDVIDLVDEHQIYVSQYYGGREKGCGVTELLQLIELMVKKGWNFPWDKAAIQDVNQQGLVTDVADLFRSTELRHRFGTVYALCYSVARLRKDLRPELAVRLHVPFTISLLPFSVLRLLRGLDIRLGKYGALLETKPTAESYRTIMEELLISGKTCAHLEDPEFGEYATQLYKAQLKRQLKS